MGAVDSSTLIDFPRPDGATSGDVGADALVEIDVAIAMVGAGAARRVRLTALPFVESVAAVALAHARAAGIAFQLERPDRIGVRTVTIGPLDAHNQE